MKIDNESLVIIGLGAAVYYFMNKKTTTIAVVKNKLIDAVDTGMEYIKLDSSLNSTPKSQADCAEGLVFDRYYPCGIPGCDWSEECVTPKQKQERKMVPSIPSVRPMQPLGIESHSNLIYANALGKRLEF